MKKTLTVIALVLGVCSVSMAGLINLSPTASGTVAVDETVLGGDTTTTGNFPAAEAPEFALDDNIGTKYLQFGGDDLMGANTGLIVFFDEPVEIEAIRFGFGNDAPERDPGGLTIEGSNAVNLATYPGSGTIADGPAWTPIVSNGVTGLVDPADTFLDAFNARGTFTDEAPFFRSATAFNNDTAYSAYRILFPSVRLEAGIMQVAEVQLLGVPEPSSFALIALALGGLTVIRRRR